VNGACAGIGLVHALCCDVRFVASGAKLATSFVRRGLAPEFASGWLLTRIVGAGHAADLMLSARTIDGAEAASIGLAHRAVALEELMDVALEYARDVATNCSPRALAYAKQDLLADWTRSRADADRDSALIYSRPGHSEDLKEGVTSYVEKRPPRFEPLPPRAS
jgi:enoyl-CoA hydratase/carnithine racemase